MTAGSSTVLHLPHCVATDVFNIASRSSAGTARVVDFDPTTTQIAASLGRHIDHVGMFLLSIRSKLASQFEVDLRRLVSENFLVGQRRFDFAIYKENYFIIGGRKIADAEIAARIGPSNFLKPASILRCDVHFSAGDGLTFGIFNYALNSGGSDWLRSPSGDRRNNQSSNSEVERFEDHRNAMLHRRACPRKQCQTLPGIFAPVIVSSRRSFVGEDRG